MEKNNDRIEKQAPNEVRTIFVLKEFTKYNMKNLKLKQVEYSLIKDVTKSVATYFLPFT